MNKRVLISVSDKKGIVGCAEDFSRLGVQVISTGGTARYLAENDIPVTPVEAVTGFPEMMNGRIKTMHPKIMGAILADLTIADHVRAMAEHDIHPIDFVVVNLYPFAKTIESPETTLQEAVEQIDIGGPTMLRSAAKNFERTTVIVDPADYNRVILELNDTGEVSLDLRLELANKVFDHTAQYDLAIAVYLHGIRAAMSAESRR